MPNVQMYFDHKLLGTDKVFLIKNRFNKDYLTKKDYVSYISEN